MRNNESTMVQKIIYPLGLVLLLGWLFLGLGEQILYAKSGSARILPVVLIFGGIPLCLYKTLRLFLEKKRASNLSALSILLLGPGFGLWSKHLAENDFKTFGAITYGKVIERVWTTANNRGRWTITAEFTYKTKKYRTFSKDDNDNEFQLHDPVRIRFSKRNPENNEIAE